MEDDLVSGVLDEKKKHNEAMSVTQSLKSADRAYGSWMSGIASLAWCEPILVRRPYLDEGGTGSFGMRKI